MKSKSVRFLVLFIIFSLLLTVFTACGKDEKVDTPSTDSGQTEERDKDTSKSGDKDDDKSKEIDFWGRYEEPVTVRFAMSHTADGFDWEDNVWTRAWEDLFNIKTEIIWDTGTDEAYQTKFAMAMMTGDLPDYMYVNSSQFRQLVDSGYAADITEAYNYVYPYLRENVFEFEGAQDQEIAFVDGVRYGIAVGGATSTDSKRLFYIRKDYLEAVNAEIPTTVEELIDLGKKFVDEGLAKYALPLLGKVVEEGYSDIIAVANAYGVYPCAWVDDGNNGMTYGSIDPGMENVLNIYRDLYDNGYISPTFATDIGDDLTEQIMNGEVGILTGEFWLPTWPLPDLKDENGDVVDWIALPIMPSAGNADFKIQAQGSPADTEFVVVRNGFEHPEAIMKLLNHRCAMRDDPEMADEEFHTIIGDDGEEIQTHMHCPITQYFDTANKNMFSYVAVTDAIDNGNMDALVHPHDELQYKNVTNYLKAVEEGNQEAANAGWAMYKLFYGDHSVFGTFYSNWTNDRYIWDKLDKRTENYERLWGTMQQFENTFYVNYIGRTEDTTFSQFVEEWNAMGGELLTYELNN